MDCFFFQTTMNLNELSNDVIETILGYIKSEPYTICASSVCKRWNQLSKKLVVKSKARRTESPFVIAIEFFASNGHLSILKWLHQIWPNNMGWTDSQLTYYAARAGHLDILKWAREKNLPWDEYTCKNAALTGQLACLQWLHDNGCPWDESTTENAALGGHLNVLKYARSAGCPSWLDSICIAAAQSGSIEALQWILENDGSWDERAAAAAASEGHWELLKWAHDYGCPMVDERVCAAAVKNLPMLKWLRENGSSWDGSLYMSAAEHGQLETMKWAHENGCEWNSYCAETAARVGSFEIIKWITKTGLEMNDEDCIFAAEDYGHWEIAKFLKNKIGKDSDDDE